MPDVNGFNLLGTKVACIEEGCDAAGYVWDWPEKDRARHCARHERERNTTAAKAARARARAALRLAAQRDRENAIAYGEVGS